jgi:hypothetical protein
MHQLISLGDWVRVSCQLNNSSSSDRTGAHGTFSKVVVTAEVMSIIESNLLHLRAAAHAKLWLQGRETGHVEVPSD